MDMYVYQRRWFLREDRELKVQFQGSYGPPVKVYYVGYL